MEAWGILLRHRRRWEQPLHARPPLPYQAPAAATGWSGGCRLCDPALGAGAGAGQEEDAAAAGAVGAVVAQIPIQIRALQGLHPPYQGLSVSYPTNPNSVTLYPWLLGQRNRKREKKNDFFPSLISPFVVVVVCCNAMQICNAKANVVACLLPWPLLIGDPHCQWRANQPIITTTLSVLS